MARARLQRSRLEVGAAVVAGVAALAYARAWSFGFIYDDYWTIVGNTHLDKSFRELVAAALSGRAVEWSMPDATRPMIGLSLWLDRRLFGLSPSGYHVHSLVIYAIVCVVAFLLAFAVLRRFVPALCAGVVFAALPLHVEVATVINYREDLIAALGLFGAAALWFWPSRSVGRWRTIGCGLLWAYALFGKESALVGPAFVASLALARRSIGWRPQALPPIGLVCAVVAAAWLNWRFGVSRLGEQIPTASLSLSERVLRTARFEVLSAWKSFIPFGPQPEREGPGSAHGLWLLAFALLVAGVVHLARRRRTRVLAAAGAVALVAPLFTSPLIAPINELADRYWFVGSLAAALVIGWAASQVAVRRAVPLVAVLVVSCCVASSRASVVWASEVDLWSAVVQNAPGSVRAWTAVSRVHRMADQEQLAERAIARALSLKPDSLPALTARVLNELWFGRLDVARAQLRALEERQLSFGDSLRIARRCAAAPDSAAAQACARRSVPAGMVLGDAQRMRALTERLLADPALVPAAAPPAALLVRSEPGAPFAGAVPDAGAARVVPVAQ